MGVQLDDGAEQLAAAKGNAPAAGMGDFGQAAADVQTLEQAGDPVGLTDPLGGVGGVPPQGPANVPVAETAYQVIARENGLEQTDVVATRRIETGVATPAGDFGLDEFGDLRVGGGRIAHDRQGVEVRCVGAAGDLLLAGEVGDPLFMGHQILGRCPCRSRRRRTRNSRGGLIPVSARRIRPNLSSIFSPLSFTRCLTRAPGYRFFFRSVSPSPWKLPWSLRPRK